MYRIPGKLRMLFLAAMKTMRTSAQTFVLIFASFTKALNLTGPAAGSVLRRGSEFALQWSYVDTDDLSFSVYLWNFVNYPPMYTPLKFDVQSRTGQTNINIPCAVDPGDGYQL